MAVTVVVFNLLSFKDYFVDDAGEAENELNWLYYTSDYRQDLRLVHMVEEGRTLFGAFHWWLVILGINWNPISLIIWL